MEEFSVSKSAILESIDEAKKYASKLEDLTIAVEKAKEQILNSALKADADIDHSFDVLSRTLVDSLNRRKKTLKEEVERIRKDGLQPLIDCEEIIHSKISETKDYIKEGEELLDKEASQSSGLNCFAEFSEQSVFLGSLPAVPQPEEVPDISFSIAVEPLQEELRQRFLSAGRVSKMGPVQVMLVEEKPGALLVHWEEVDMERVVDVSSFRLQMAYGDMASRNSLLESNFHDVYQGPETQHLVRDLRQGEPYTFRVCCRVEGDTEWSAWSLPHVASSNQEPFCWDQKNPNYTITNENKLATKVTADQSVLFSHNEQFGPGHSIEFTILECGVGCSDEGLGLVDVRIEGENLLQPGALFLNSQGCVFVDGIEKTTKLPPLEKGSKVCFTCEHIRDNKIRVNIDSNNKTVTYDWKVSSPELKVYFAVCFGQKGWKVLVE
ncbi:hypothetical protein R5R35_010779 [Gryllus longicercus]|uniref:Fibronectin type-III domain-containing protein n=1 Tax=Gryllus longicercus TaxID=2509291 RepID=A0AAN9Z4Z7_9ORTH